MPSSALLSMAFAPDYATSGRFYVYYVASNDNIQIRVRMRCSAKASIRCHGSLALRRGALIVARATFSAAPGQLVAPRMRLTARGRALVRQRHRLAVQAAARSSDASRRSVRSTARIVLVA